MTERTVKLAYVTKWATTRGILVVEGGTAKGGYLSAGRGWSRIFIAPCHWTVSKDEAEYQYRLAHDKEIAATERKLMKLRKAMAGPINYADHGGTQ